MGMNVCVIGAGYVGLPLAISMAEKGHRVVCVDSNADKIRMLNNNSLPFHEPDLYSAMQKVVTDKNSRLTFSHNLPQAIYNSLVVFICVGTPLTEDNGLDTSQLMAVAREIPQYIEDYKAIVIKSTVPVGTCMAVKKVIDERLIETAEIDIVSNPEFMREGSALYDMNHADRIVIGTENIYAMQLMMELYENFESQLVLTDIASAEMIKLTSNAFLATKISFANSIAELCEKTGADVTEVMRGVGMDKRIGGEFLKAGLGFGGYCLPKDLAHLIQTGKANKCKMPILEAAKTINENSVDRFVSLIEQTLNGCKGKTIAVWGLSFKPNTDDFRDSRAIKTIVKLLEKGALIKAHDPVAIPAARKEITSIIYASNEYEAIVGADALVIATDWPQYAKADLNNLKNFMNKPLVFDGRNIFDPIEMSMAGIEYYSVGRANIPPEAKMTVKPSQE